jgi:formylglycine-generating enzyme required for sulfatase activity
VRQVRRVRRVRCGAQVHGCGAQVRQVRGTAAIVVLALTFACAQAPSVPPTWVEPTTGMTFVQIPAGEFEMGSPASEPGHQENERQHRVRLTRAVLFGIREVTEREWNALISPGAAATLPDRPVVNVTWTDVQAFIARLNRLGHGRFRLPTEAEWEYAARGGTATTYPWGATMVKERANCVGCNDPTRRQAVEVGQYPANGFGLYDMAGNAAEWVADCWSDSYRTTPRDGSAFNAPGCRERVLRGGSFNNDPRYLRSAARFKYEADVRFYTNGFRVVREP